MKKKQKNSLKSTKHNILNVCNCNKFNECDHQSTFDHNEVLSTRCKVIARSLFVIPGPSKSPKSFKGDISNFASSTYPEPTPPIK